MTEYEMADLFDSLYATAFTMSSISMTLVSGFLVASFVAAHRLSRTMTGLALGIYTWMTFLMINASYRQFSIISGLYSKMRDFNTSGKGLEWHTGALSPAATTDATPYAISAFGVIVFVATIYFFFHCRRVNTKADAGA
jgi:hypothetical protein